MSNNVVNDTKKTRYLKLLRSAATATAVSVKKFTHLRKIESSDMSVGKIPVLTRVQEDNILKSINYTREQLKLDTVLLRKWLNDQQHFPESRKNEPDCFLVSYLVGCKGSIEKAKQKLDKYYSIRGHGDMFSDRDNFDYLDQAFTFTVYAPLTETLPDGTFVTLTAHHDLNIDKYNPLNGFKTAVLYVEYRLRHGSGIHGGEIFLCDVAGVSASYATKLNPSWFKPLITWIQEASPLRFKKYLAFNADPILHTIANTFVKPALSRKLQDKFILTKGCDLTKHLDPIDILPSCYGGKKPDRMTISWAFKETLKEGLAPIIADLGLQTNESKRPQLNGFANNPHFGQFGSIKTLVTD